MITGHHTAGSANADYDYVTSSSLLICGAGRSCTTFENETHTLYTPRDALGPVRCPACAVRLGWIAP